MAIIQALGPIVAVLIAVWLWRLQVVGKRKFEVAEQVLVAAQAAIDHLRSNRAPFASSSETQDALAWHERTDDPSGPQKFGLVILRRIDRSRDAYLELEKARTLARYLISDKASRAVDEILNARAELAGAAITRAQYSELSELGDGFDDINRTLTGTFSDRDQFHKKMINAMNNVEQECAPLLRAWINPFSQLKLKLF